MDDELADDVHLDFDRFLCTGSDQNFRAVARHVDGRTENGTGSVAGTDATDARDQNVVAAILGRVVRTAMGLDAPVARKLRGYAARARQMGGTVEEGEIRGYEIRAGCRANGEFSGEVVCGINE